MFNLNVFFFYAISCAGIYIYGYRMKDHGFMHGLSNFYSFLVRKAGYSAIPARGIL